MKARRGRRGGEGCHLSHVPTRRNGLSVNPNRPRAGRCWLFWRVWVLWTVWTLNYWLSDGARVA
jgi:hypothetical protein